MGKARAVRCQVLGVASARAAEGGQGVWQADGFLELHACAQPLKVPRRLTREPLVRATRPPSTVSNRMQAGGIWWWEASAI